MCLNSSLQTLFESFLPINILRGTPDVNADKRLPLNIKWSLKVSDRNGDSNISKNVYKILLYHTS